MKTFRILRIALRVLLLLVALLTVPFLALDLLMWMVIVTQPQQWHLPMPPLVAFAGTFGWIALIRLTTLMNRPLLHLPGWVVYGVLAGIVSAAAFGITLGKMGGLALFPMWASIALLLNCALVANKEDSPCKTS